MIQNQFHHLIFPNLLLLRESSCWKQFSIFSPFKTFDKYAFWLLDLFAVLSIVIGGDIETPGRQARDIRTTTHINTLEVLQVLKLLIWMCAFIVCIPHVCAQITRGIYNMFHLYVRYESMEYFIKRTMNDKSQNVSNLKLIVRKQ